MLDDPQMRTGLARLAFWTALIGLGGMAIWLIGAIAPVPLDKIIGNAMKTLGGGIAIGCFSLAALMLGVLLYADRRRY